ncbi:putative secreted RxLR effector protein [Phytophthora cinnamomi]|uniref:putative secreted RxLR effector protein n=1 Tax=Phytophthora cinnamomi TaxID=4785 RepID=UPI003559D9A1|nr:putative secreted RxLR effector protein [Phytophthora cinnamomi]
MRSYLLALLLCAVALTIGVNSAEVTSDSKVVKSNVAGVRNLRKRSSASENENEERAYINTAWIAESLVNWAKSSKWTDEQLENLLQKGASADEVFKLFQLDNGMSKLLTNGNLKSWETYVGMLNKQNPDKEVSVIKTITNIYGDEEVAKVLFTAKSSLWTKDVATDLQKALYKQWILEKKTPNNVWDLLKLDRKTTYENPYDKIWWEYVDELAKAVSKA